MSPVWNLEFRSGKRKTMTDKSGEQGGSTLTESIPWDSSWPGLAGEAERHRLFFYLEKRFGIPEEIFAPFLLFRRRKTWWLLHHSKRVPLPAHLKVSIVGLKAFDQVGKHLKPTTRMIQIFGNHATKGVHELSQEGFERLVRGGLLKINTDLEDGFVILRLGEKVLGIGLLIQSTISARIKQSELKQMVIE
jgi:NOL1/NOP2/fmu family ribosome biogenesis protein